MFQYTYLISYLFDLSSMRNQTKRPIENRRDASVFHMFDEAMVGSDCPGESMLSDNQEFMAVAWNVEEMK